MAAQAGVPAALGFLLLIPLHPLALWQQNSTSHNAQRAQIRRAERNLVQLRQAVTAATSSTDLQQRLQTLRGPSLGPPQPGTAADGTHRSR